MRTATQKKTRAKAFAWALAACVMSLVLLPGGAVGQTIPDDGSDFVIDDTSRLPSLTGGATTTGSAVVTVDDTSALVAGAAISGTGIPTTARVLSVDSATQVTLDSNATADGAGLTLNAANPAVPANGAGTTDVNSIDITDGGMQRVIDIGAGTLRLGADGALRRTVTTNNRVLVEGGTLTAGGADDTAGNLLLRSAGTTGAGERARQSLVINSDITDNGAGAVSVSKSGDYITALTGNNTYTGGTTVLGGYLRSTVADNLGTGAVTVQGTSSAGDPGVHLNGGGVYNNDFFISGTGADLYKSNLDGRGAIWLGTGAEVAGTVTLTGNARITPIAATASEISGKITGDYALEIGNGHNTHMGVMTLSNPDNDWSGNTSVRCWSTSGTGTSTLKLGASEVIPHGPGKGDLRFGLNSTTPTLTFDMNGFSETINGLVSYQNTSTNKRVIRSNAAGPVTLTVGAGDADGSFLGQIINGSGTVSVTKTGAGTQILSGSYSYSGATTVEGGILDMRGSLTGTSNVLINTGGTFLYANDGAALGRPVELAGGSFRYTSTEAYSGVLTHTSGRLEGTNWEGGLSGLTIGANQTVAPGSSPGAASTSSQIWAPDGTFEFEINDPEGTSGINWDHLAISGDLDISGLSSANPFIISLVSLTVADEPGPLDGFDPDADYQWEFVSFGSLTGTFNANLFQVDTTGFEDDLAGGKTFAVMTDGSSLSIGVIPEPATGILLVAGVLLALRRRFFI